MAVSTIGGNIAENAGGLRGLKYGVTKDYVMGLEVHDRHRRAREDRGLRAGECAYRLQPRRPARGLGRHARHLPASAVLKLVPPPQGFQGHDGRVRRTCRTRLARPWPGSSPRTLSPVRWNSWTTRPSTIVEDYVNIGLPRDAAGHPAHRSGRPCRRRSPTRPSASRNRSSRSAARTRSCGRQGCRGKERGSGKPAAWRCPPWPAASPTTDARRRDRAAFQDSRPCSRRSIKIAAAPSTM